MRFNASRMFSKMSSWYTQPTPWTKRTLWSLHRPLRYMWLKLMLWYRWVLNWPLELWLCILWTNLLQWYRTLHLWPLWPWPNMLWYNLLLWNSTNTWHSLSLTLYITKLSLISITPICISFFLITLKIFIPFIISISSYTQRLPKWKG
ncbi:hypothetical protein HanIR_Chr16g0804951 [Helianthus annuus]|nr:hypothetical protein HanIR_Chr16g0804951 [Helianthus annuus]